MIVTIGIRHLHQHQFLDIARHGGLGNINALVAQGAGSVLLRLYLMIINYLLDFCMSGHFHLHHLNCNLLKLKLVYTLRISFCCQVW